MSNLMNTIEPLGVNIIGSKGVFLERDNGQLLYDLFNDVGVVGLGHSALDGIFYELSKGEPYSIPAILGSRYRELAASKLSMVMRYDKVFFCNSGTEAIEAAIKLARRYKKVVKHDERDIMYTLKGVFHGRTYGALSASDAAPYHKEDFEPFLPGFEHFTEIEEIDWNRCYAVMVTPAFVNKDVRIFPEGWLEDLASIAHSEDALFIVDEIQTGFGRCGEWKMTDCMDIQPDIIAVGKGIANGLPVGAILADDRIAQVFTPGRHFSTYGGVPIGMMAVNKVIDGVAPIIDSAEVYAKGNYFMNELNGLGFMKNARGQGLLIAVDLEGGGAKEFCRRCIELGVMVVTFDDNCLKMTPPLTITMDDIDNIIGVFQEAYKG